MQKKSHQENATQESKIHVFDPKNVRILHDGENRTTVQFSADIDKVIEHFDPVKNVRNRENMEVGYLLSDFAREIGNDGEVREPVQVALNPKLSVADIEKMTPEEIVNAIAEPLKGFRRVHALHKAVHDPSINDRGKINKFIPIVAHVGFTMEEILSWRLDHGSQKGLNDYELMLCVRELETSGVNWKSWEIVWKLRHLFAAAASSKVRSDWENRLADVAKKGKEEGRSSEWILRNQQEETFKLFKGRYQKAQRLAITPHEELRDAFKAEVYGLESPIKFTSERLVKSHSMDRAEFEKVLNEWKINDGAIKPEARHWTLKVMQEKANIFKTSTRLDSFFKAILGDTAEQQKLAALRDQMMIEEAARKADPEAYDAFIKQLAEGKKPMKKAANQ